MGHKFEQSPLSNEKWPFDEYLKDKLFSKILLIVLVFDLADKLPQFIKRPQFY